ncbi:MAG TPA: glycosyltransferase, partial [Vicinamibacterales bacterium]|nr:glycosyltransferase [Vicinamibacterales bacterium]
MADRQLTRPPGVPRVSINIPCYHQLAQARRCVASVLAQTLTDLEITLLDDGAADEYRDYVSALGDGRVRYQRNPERLGAMRNMFQAITAGRGTYTIAFHEDDLLGSHYLATAVDILERDPSCGFVGGQLREFTDEPSADALGRPAANPAVTRYASAADFRAAVDGIPAEHDTFATLVDRPFLLAILARWSAAIIEEPMVWYRHHGDGDARHLEMK